MSSQKEADPGDQEAARREARETRNLVLAAAAIEGVVLVPLLFYLILR